MNEKLDKAVLRRAVMETTMRGTEVNLEGNGHKIRLARKVEPAACGTLATPCYFLDNKPSSYDSVVAACC
jgi:hypothetical protein